MDRDYITGDPLVLLANIASEPDDFMLSGGGTISMGKKTYSVLRSEESDMKLNPIFAFLISVLSGISSIKLRNDQKLLRELTVIEIARRKRPEHLASLENEYDEMH